MGYRMVIDAISATLTVTRAIREAYTALRDRGIWNFTYEEHIELRQKVEELIDQPQHYQIEERTVERNL